MEPSYTFNNFVSACSKGVGSVYVIKGARETAKTHFGLETNIAILGFIGNNGLENPRFVNTGVWRNNPDKEKPIMEDEYEFSTGKKLGYLAFFFQPKTNQWNIKSFKLSQQPMIKNFAFEDLKKLLDDKEEPKNE